MWDLDSELMTAVILTIIIEVPIFYICGYKKASQLLAFLFVNYVSNTLLNEGMPGYTTEFAYWINLLIGEILVVIFEFAVMLHFIQEDKVKLLRTIFLTNAASLIIGLIILFIL